MNYQSRAEVIEAARSYIREDLQRGSALTDPEVTATYLSLGVGQLDHEVFGILHLDNRHRIIEDERLFRGTIDGAAVYPREVAKACLRHNAAAVIIYHNHPSGLAEPSRADRDLTRRLVEALGLLDIRILDHIVIGGMEHTSFAERGWL